MIVLAILLQASFSTFTDNLREGEIDGHLTILQMERFLQELVNRKPNNVSLERLGDTFQKQVIKGLHISSSNEQNSAVLITGQFTTEQPAIAQAILHLADQLTSDQMDSLYYGLEFWIFPLINYDSYLKAQINYDGQFPVYEKNQKPVQCENNSLQGVNIMMNFDWNFKVVENQCFAQYAGSFPFSELESVKLKDLLNFRKSIKMWIHFEGNQNTIYYPSETSSGYTQTQFDGIFELVDRIAEENAFISGDWEEQEHEDHGMWMYWAEKQKVLPFQVGLGPKNAIRENLDAIFVNVEKVIPKFIQFASYNPVIRIMESDLIECKKENLCNQQDKHENSVLMFEVQNMGLSTLPPSNIEIELQGMTGHKFPIQVEVMVLIDGGYTSQGMTVIKAIEIGQMKIKTEQDFLETLIIGQPELQPYQKILILVLADFMQQVGEEPYLYSVSLKFDIAGESENTPTLAQSFKETKPLKQAQLDVLKKKNDDDDDDDEEMRYSLIIAGIMILVVIIILIVVCTIRCCKKKSKHENQQEFEPIPNPFDTPPLDSNEDRV